jgi:iron(III) transport system substrate-binding protein
MIQHWRRLAMTVMAMAVVLSACGSNDVVEQSETSRQVTVYTGRHYGIEPVFEEFTAATGIRVRFTTGSDPELRERLAAEGANTPADLIMTADAANIELAGAAGLLSAVDSDVLRDAIPAELRAADDTWFSLSRRLRVIMSSKDRVENPPTTYESLGDPQWKGRLCLRPSTHPYTQSLVAGLINNLGEDAARKIVDGWVMNDPLYINSDTDILKAIAAGDCDIALANSYYLGRLLTEDAAFQVTLTWPNQESFGAHLNVSAAAVTAASANRAEAIELLEWLATDGQKTFSDANNEFPANPKVKPRAIIAGFGSFVADVKSVRELGRLNPVAVELLSAAKYK